ncbi:band 7 protein AGAP004871-like isoform X7 [Daphnia carinata]|uniref:band 7 protein AGAP004871-like isoform X7 n=1 Tax=Daphnia carinata TaxID=120202 RepID=UPI00257B1592|nr:band 7 protein AGAP004871-like isoform X7 [Daphnia carinata]
MFALELASAPINSSFSDRFGGGGGGSGDEPASSIPPEFRSKYSTSFADYPQPLSDPVRTRIWGPPVVRGSADPGGPGICAFILTLFSFLLILATFPLSLCFSVKVVQEYERAVIFRLGRLLKGGARGPGIFFIVPCIDTYRKIDLRTVSFDVPPQEILSRDSVTVAVDAVVYYRVQNPTIAVSNVENFSHSTRLLAATTLRNVLGTKNLAEILSERETISHTMQSSLDEATDPWGVKVERVEIKDVRLPVQLQRAMAAEAEAAREARAKVIAAEGEQKASHALREAAEIISESPGALQLRYLQTLNTISAEKNSTIIFPLPIDILKHFLKPDKKEKKEMR